MSDRDRPPPNPPEPASPPRDVLFVCGEGETGDYGVIRQRAEQLEVGRIRPIKDGQPLAGELLRLEQRKEHARLFDVEVIHDTTPRRATSAGPAQVATKAYREQWDRIFGAVSPAPLPGDREIN